MLCIRTEFHEIYIIRQLLGNGRQEQMSKRERSDGEYSGEYSEEVHSGGEYSGEGTKATKHQPTQQEIDEETFRDIVLPSNRRFGTPTHIEYRAAVLEHMEYLQMRLEAAEKIILHKEAVLATKNQFNAPVTYAGAQESIIAQRKIVASLQHKIARLVAHHNESLRISEEQVRNKIRGLCKKDLEIDVSGFKLRVGTIKGVPRKTTERYVVSVENGPIPPCAKNHGSITCGAIMVVVGNGGSKYLELCDHPLDGNFKCDLDHYNGMPNEETLKLVNGASKTHYHIECLGFLVRFPKTCGGCVGCMAQMFHCLCCHQRLQTQDRYLCSECIKLSPKDEPAVLLFGDMPKYY